MEDLESIASYLPPLLRGSSPLSFSWPLPVTELLEKLALGPEHSNVNSGELLFVTISDIRSELSLFEPLERSTAEGYSLFFDQLLSHDEASKWFGDVLPAMANLLLRLPSLLEAHYQNTNKEFKTCLRLLQPQESGIVFLSQELIGALLACSYFCLFPLTDRAVNGLQGINFDYFFATLYQSCTEMQENKIRCIIHYFKKIFSSMPGGLLSFERKVLSLEHIPPAISYPSAELWSKSCMPLCRFEVYKSGLIEDQSFEALEVDFANKYLGGGALKRGCVQEEILFMICPELIVGMLFLPAMADNEAIEIVGAERFSNHTGYASTFRFSGNYVDERVLDIMGRRKRRIIAMDAICRVGKKQFGNEFLLREVNKAYCGFLDQSHLRQCQGLDKEDKNTYLQVDGGDDKYPEGVFTESHMICQVPITSSTGRQLGEGLTDSSKGKHKSCVDNQDGIGIATGNWGCGAFGGDPELKATLQWIAASQAGRPFLLYYTFGLKELENLDQVTQWVLSQKWTIGELWNLLLEYSSQRLEGKTKFGFFTWLLPPKSVYDPHDRYPSEGKHSAVFYHSKYIQKNRPDRFC